MTRSEEHLRVDTERREAGRARLRKYVVTENVEQPVRVRREEVRLEREPTTDENRDTALAGPDITDDEYEVTLHEEHPVVDTEVRPVERVRLGTEAVHRARDRARRGPQGADRGRRARRPHPVRHRARGHGSSSG